MTTQTQQIIDLFNELGDAEKMKCLKTLQFNADPSMVIKRFSERHQKVHKSNIEFKSTTTITGGNVSTSVDLITAFGKFTAAAATSIEAKCLAVREANNEEFGKINEVPNNSLLTKCESYCPLDRTFSDEIIS